MTAIAIHATTDTTAATLIADLTSGVARLYKERDNGTFRRVHFLADNTEAREHAEWVALQREEGRSMKAIATEINLSVSAVRRMLNDLALTEELEGMEAEDLADLLLGSEEDQEPATEADLLADKVLAGDMSAEDAITTLLS